MSNLRPKNAAVEDSPPLVTRCSVIKWSKEMDGAVNSVEP